jgi:hypothetical protein
MKSLTAQYKAIKNKQGLVWASHDESDIEIFNKGDRDIKFVLENLEKRGADNFTVYQDWQDRVVIKEAREMMPYHLI